MNKNIYNPFNRVAGVEALGIGLVVMLIISIIAHYTLVTFPSILSAHVGSKVQLPILRNISQVFGHWFIFSTILYLIAYFAGKTQIRAIDVFGTQALARIPFLIFASLGYVDFNLTIDSITKSIAKNGTQVSGLPHIPLSGIVFLAAFVLVTLCILVWVIALMYNAFRVSTNIKGEKSVILFIFAILISMVVSYYFELQMARLIS